MRGVDLAALPGPLDFVLPPNPDAIANGGFETGDATGWQAGAWQPAFVPTVRDRIGPLWRLGTEFQFHCRRRAS